jgi:hypothetical protein
VVPAGMALGISITVLCGTNRAATSDDSSDNVMTRSAALHRQIDRKAYHGYRVIGCCLPYDPADPAATSCE